MTKYILAELYNEEPTLVPLDTEGKMLVSGSILQFARPGDILAGVGSFSTMPDDWEIPVTDIRFVRGPRTAKHLGRSDLVYGDAGLLMPNVYAPNRTSAEYDYGIIPHYADAAYVESVPSNCIVINVNLSVTQFVDQIVRCRNIVSSSLHGIVLAEAYGVPAIRITINNSRDRIASFDFKHADYYEGTDRELPQAISLCQAFDTAGVAVNLTKQIETIYRELGSD